MRHNATRFSVFFLKQAARLAAERPAPRFVSRSGKEGRAVDCISLTVGFDGEPPDEFLIEGHSEHALDGLSWNDEQFRDSVSVPFSLFRPFSVRIRRFIGLHQLTYDNVFKFVVYECVRLTYLIVLWEKLKQGAYNYRTAVRTERMDTLKALVEVRVSRAEDDGSGYSRDNGVAPYELLFRMHNVRITGHPKFKRLHEKYRMNLESLAQSGDAIEKDGRYKAAGKAIESISNYEEEERRFSVQARHNRLLLLLTFVLAIAAFVQILEAETLRALVR